MKFSLATIEGCFGILRRRSHEAGHPGLAVWTDLGQRATHDLGAAVRKSAHADEVADLEAGKAIAAGLDGLKDGRVDAADLDHFRRAARLTARSAELAHDISEVVR